jgi:hypothetical protein
MTKFHVFAKDRLASGEYLLGPGDLLALLFGILWGIGSL